MRTGLRRSAGNHIRYGHAPETSGQLGPGDEIRRCSAAHRADFTRRSAVEIKNGVDVLRAVVRARRFKSHLSSLARDLNVPVGDLEDFVDSGRELPMPVLQKLAREFFDAEIDVATGLLRSANRNEATPMPDTATYPPPYSPKTPEQRVFWRAMREMEAIKQPCAAPQPEPPKEKKSRPGWIGGFW